MSKKIYIFFIKMKFAQYVQFFKLNRFFFKRQHEYIPFSEFLFMTIKNSSAFTYYKGLTTVLWKMSELQNNSIKTCFGQETITTCIAYQSLQMCNSNFSAISFRSKSINIFILKFVTVTRYVQQ